MTPPKKCRIRQIWWEKSAEPELFTPDYENSNIFALEKVKKSKTLGGIS
jgi:hypothetical protein